MEWKGKCLRAKCSLQQQARTYFIKQYLHKRRRGGAYDIVRHGLLPYHEDGSLGEATSGECLKDTPTAKTPRNRHSHLLVQPEAVAIHPPPYPPFSQLLTLSPQALYRVQVASVSQNQCTKVDRSA